MLIPDNIHTYIHSYGLGVPGFENRLEQDNFLLSRTLFWSTHPHIVWVIGSLTGVKRPGREVHHSPPSSAEAKNVWSYTSTPTYTFMAWTGETLRKLGMLPYISLPFPWKLPDIFAEPFLSGVRRLSRTVARMVALPLAKFRSQSNKVLHAGSSCPQSGR